MVEIGPKKKRFFLLILSGFSYALLQSMSYAPRFWQMKDLIKIHIRGNFRQHRVCGCEVKNFQKFFAGLLFPKILINIAEVLNRASFQW